MPAPANAPEAVPTESLRLDRRLYAEMIQHLIEALPNEGCGLIAFDDDHPVKVYPGVNILHSPRRYRMDDLEVLRALDDMDRHGWWLGAIYHSHPHSQPTPSTTDLREANWPDALMIIVSLDRQQEQPDARAWRIVDDAFQPVAIELYSERARWLARLLPRSRGADRQPRPTRQVWQPVGHGAAGRQLLATRGSEQATREGCVPGGPTAVAPDHEQQRRAVIGILGGMGPLATADLYQKIIQATPAAIDQEHIPVVVYADPRVPDRSDALTRGGEDPTPWLIHGAQALATLGATFIVMPCNTAHAFLPGVQSQIDRPFLSMIETAVDAVVARQPGAGVVGLLATSGTLASKVYQRALRSRGLDAIVPDDAGQRRCVSAAIQAVKAGQVGRETTALLVEAADELVRRGADVLIAACTEIPLVLQARDVGVPLIDATQELALAAAATAQRLDDAARAGTPMWETTQIGPIASANAERRD